MGNTGILKHTTRAAYKTILQEHQIVIPLVVVFITASIITPNFFEADNLINILRQISVLSIISIGSTMVILSGGIDLSVGSIMALVGVFVANGIKSEMPLPILILLGLLFGMVIGCMNGLFIINFTVPAFIVTLATMTIGRGFVLLWTGGGNVSELDNQRFLFLGRGSVLGIPFPVVVLVLLFIIGCGMLSYTRFGREIYAIGNNVKASKVAGIYIKRVELSVYILAGLLAAIGAVIDTSRMNTVTPMYGRGIEFNCVAAVILGGASLDGGAGHLVNTLYGAALLGIISNALNLLGVSSYWGQVAKGLILILAIMIYSYKNK
jgi:ribose transport system permease protein